MCISRLLACVATWSQLVHVQANGLSPVCVLMCLLRLLASEVAWSQLVRCLISRSSRSSWGSNCACSTSIHSEMDLRKATRIFRVAFGGRLSAMGNQAVDRTTAIDATRNTPLARCHQSRCRQARTVAPYEQPRGCRGTPQPFSGLNFIRQSAGRNSTHAARRRSRTLQAPPQPSIKRPFASHPREHKSPCDTF
jgi:hypothetical protein